MEIAVFSGLERIIIIASGMLIGYWGYRLYTRDRTPGLLFMAIASVLLFGALLTGGNVQPTYDVARALDPAPVPATEDQAIAATGTLMPSIPPSAPATAAESPATTERNSPFLDAQLDSDDAPAPADLEVVAATEESVEATQPAPEPRPASIPRLATGQELGGRIVSVKSENISLEWTPADG